jgi:hypothetical protein
LSSLFTFEPLKYAYKLMDTRILLVSFLIIFWWVAMWGLIELVLKGIVGNSPWKAGLAYSFMIVFVLSIIYMYPGLIERFL